MKKRMFMALAVALTGVSMVVAAGNGELKIQSETSVQKVHAAEIHQIGVEPIPATGQITIEDLLAVQGGETEDPRALEGVSDPEDVPVDEASVEDTTADEYASLAIANVTNYVNVRTEPNTDSAVSGAKSMTERWHRSWMWQERIRTGFGSSPVMWRAISRQSFSFTEMQQLRL